MLLGGPAWWRRCKHWVEAGAHCGLRCCGRHLKAHVQVGALTQRQRLAVAVHLEFD